MINISSLTLMKPDGSQSTVTIEPMFISLPESTYFTGVYRILETDMTGKELGEVAFNLDDNQIWEFTGEHFSMEEQEQSSISSERKSRLILSHLPKILMV